MRLYRDIERELQRRVSYPVPTRLDDKLGLVWIDWYPYTLEMIEDEGVEMIVSMWLDMLQRPGVGVE